MGKIKSAWEIALERTENIKIDEDKIRRNGNIEKIKRIAGAFLSSDTPDPNKTNEELQAYDRALVKETLSQMVINGLSLPQEKILDDRYDRLKTLASICSNQAQALELFDQITGFLNQYPMHRDQLISELKKQAEPVLRQKEEQMRAQYGGDIHLTAEQDKEFMSLLHDNLDKLNARYNETLGGAKEELLEALRA